MDWNRVVVELVRPVEGCGVDEEQPRVRLAASLAARRAASFDVWARVLRNEGTVGRVLGGQLRGDAMDKRRFHATGGVAAAAAWSGVGRQEERDRARRSGSRSAWRGDKRQQ